jgi:hypothetical protein
MKFKKAIQCVIALAVLVGLALWNSRSSGREQPVASTEPVTAYGNTQSECAEKHALYAELAERGHELTVAQSKTAAACLVRGW